MLLRAFNNTKKDNTFGIETDDESRLFSVENKDGYPNHNSLISPRVLSPLLHSSPASVLGALSHSLYHSLWNLCQSFNQSSILLQPVLTTTSSAIPSAIFSTIPEVFLSTLLLKPSLNYLFYSCSHSQPFLTTIHSTNTSRSPQRPSMIPSTILATTPSTISTIIPSILHLHTHAHIHSLTYSSSNPSTNS